jgi:hypothetical protein
VETLIYPEGTYSGTGYCPAQPCTTCGADATATWGGTGMASRFACPEHNPLTGAGRIDGDLPGGFHYMSLVQPLAMPFSARHLGVKAG